MVMLAERVGSVDEHIVLRVIIRLIVPFILLYALYLQLHGEYSPGGGFQAGVIAASAIIAYGLIKGIDSALEVLPLQFVKIGSALGVLLFAGTGILTMLLGGKFLEYGVLALDPVLGQTIGIIVIELGVGLTVFSVVMIIFYTFGLRST